MFPMSWGRGTSNEAPRSLSVRQKYGSTSGDNIWLVPLIIVWQQYLFPLTNTTFILKLSLTLKSQLILAAGSNLYTIHINTNKCRINLGTKKGIKYCPGLLNHSSSAIKAKGIFSGEMNYVFHSTQRRSLEQRYNAQYGVSIDTVPPFCLTCHAHFWRQPNHNKHSRQAAPMFTAQGDTYRRWHITLLLCLFLT